MRTITDHKLSDLNQAIEITVMDEPGPGGANHIYQLDIKLGNAVLTGPEIKFQKGAVKEAGSNGISDEALLAVNIDRLRGFQAGPFSCRENAVALTHMETALLWLQKRTRDRMARGVEGQSKP